MNEYKTFIPGTSRAVQWLKFRAPTAGDMGSISGQGTKNPHAVRGGQKQKQKQKQKTFIPETTY